MDMHLDIPNNKDFIFSQLRQLQFHFEMPPCPMSISRDAALCKKISV